MFVVAPFEAVPRTVEEHEAGGAGRRRGRAPGPPRLGYVRPVLFRRPDLLFLRVRPSRASVRQIAVRLTATPRSAAQSRNSEQVALGRRAISARIASSCPARRGGTRLRCGRGAAAPSSRKRWRTL